MVKVQVMQDPRKQTKKLLEKRQLLSGLKKKTALGLVNPAKSDTDTHTQRQG